MAININGPEFALFEMKGSRLLQIKDTSVEEVVIPKGVTEICGSTESGAFSGCRFLRTIVIPDTVTTVGEGAFSYCSSLNTITFPPSVKVLGKGVLRACTNLHSVFFGKWVKEIPDFFFYGCYKLKYVYLPDSIEVLGESVFHLCEKLQNLTLPVSLQQIGGSAFQGCEDLESLSLPDNVKEIGAYAFQGCKQLQSIHLPNTLTEIKEWTFSHCDNIKSIPIPPSVGKIGKKAFSSCQSLSSIHLPNQMREIEEEAFHSCYLLKSITLPYHLQRISQGTFSFCRALEGITMGERVEEVETRAFYGCRSLKTVRTKNPKIQLQEEVFQDDISLDYVDFPIFQQLSTVQQGTYYMTHMPKRKEKNREEGDALTTYVSTHETLQDYLFLGNQPPVIGSLLSMVEKISLSRLDEYLQHSIAAQSTEITALFLDYQHKHYDPEEIAQYHHHKDMIALGWALPTYEEFSQLWHCERGEFGLVLTGYKGGNKMEVVPQVLADGTLIVSMEYREGIPSSPILEELVIEGDFMACHLSSFPHLRRLHITGKLFQGFCGTGLSYLQSFTHVLPDAPSQSLSYDFSDCVSLSCCILPQGVQAIPSEMFQRNYNLKDLFLPDSVVDISETAFTLCHFLTVHGKKSSVMWTYCEKHQIPFVVMGSD